MNDFKYSGEELDVFGDAHNWKSYWVKKISPYIGKDVLEVGAGIGATTMAFKNVPHDSWICIEPDTLLCEKILQRKNTGEIAINVKVLNCTVEKLMGKNKFDTILYIDVLEHIKNDREELEIAFNLLKEGGRIIILSPAHNYLYSPFDKKIGHYRRYNKKLLSEIIPSGMMIKTLHFMDSVGFFASLANRLILKQSDPSRAQVAFWDKAMVPFSKIIDPILFNSAGKSILAIFQKETSQ
jgi:ubiquinone/menaquinone biosynthesis C-methylase UbiE